MARINFKTVYNFDAKTGVFILYFSTIFAYRKIKLKKNVSFSQTRDVLKEDPDFIINDKPMKFY